jgi:hypothetical protein
MAIGVDNRLKQKVYRGDPPLSVPGDGSSEKKKTYSLRASQVSDSAVADQQNTILATSAGGGRLAMQGLDRAGLSRGRGHQYRADYAQGMGQAMSQLGATQVGMNAAGANAAARQAVDSEMRANDINSRGLLESLRSGAAAQNNARKGFAQDLYEANARGRMGMASLPQLDYSSILQALLR